MNSPTEGIAPAALPLLLPLGAAFQPSMVAELVVPIGKELPGAAKNDLTIKTSFSLGIMRMKKSPALEAPGNGGIGGLMILHLGTKMMKKKKKPLVGLGF